MLLFRNRRQSSKDLPKWNVLAVNVLLVFVCIAPVPKCTEVSNRHKKR